MEHTYRCLLAIGSEELETQITKLPVVSVIDSDPDIDIITDILNYETTDFVIVNTVLSQEKSLELARKAKEKSVKVIVLIESYQERELMASLVGLGVRAFLLLGELHKIEQYLEAYPEKFDFAVLQEIKGDNQAPKRAAGIRGKLFRSGSKDGETRGLTGCQIIGVIGTCPGVGATSLCVSLSAHLSQVGKRVLVLDRTENKNLSEIQIKGLDIDTCVLSEANLSKYDYVIIDFGRLAEISADGRVAPKEDLKNEKRLERQFCKEIVLVGSSLPWKLKELSIYFRHPIFEKLTENWIFYITGEQNPLFASVRKNYQEERVMLVSYEKDDPYAALIELMEKRAKHD